MKATPTLVLFAALMISMVPASLSQEDSPDVWKPFQFFVGKWEGSGEGKSGVSRGKQEFGFVIGGQYLQVKNETVFEPQERMPKGQTHTDWGFFSYDRQRKAYVLRQFHVESFVNQYVCPAPSEDGKTFIFLSEALENLPPGFKARLTYRILDDNNFEQTFDLAAPGQEMECYAKGVLTRVGSRRPAGKEKKRPVQASPACDVRISLETASPFVPDGRSSLAELAFEVTFSSVTFEFDPDEDPLLGRCQVNTEKGEGRISRLILNDVEKNGDRVPASFLSARPSVFPCVLAVESEAMPGDEEAAESRLAPPKVRLAFWTEFGETPVRWGSKFGTETLPDLKFVFEVPFRGLLLGKAYSAASPYVGRFPEENGTWQVEIRPQPKKT